MGVYCEICKHLKVCKLPGTDDCVHFQTIGMENMSADQGRRIISHIVAQAEMEVNHAR